MTILTSDQTKVLKAWGKLRPLAEVLPQLRSDGFSDKLYRFPADYLSGGKSENSVSQHGSGI